MKKSKANILLTFIMVVALSGTVITFLSFTAIRMKDSGYKASEIESFYVAEAGLNKAIWYMATPSGSGGHGLGWRVNSLNENYGWGSYTITVADTAVSNEVQIISTGEVAGIRKTVIQKVEMGGLPVAFEYALFNNSNLSLTGNAIIDGDVYVDGNTTINANGRIENGYIYHPTGSTVSGSGGWTDGGALDPAPTLPGFDSSYYTSMIALAESAADGNVSYNNKTVNLNGGTVYVDGNVTISGNTTFNGPGTVVATGTIYISGNTYSTGSVTFVSDGAITLAGNTYTGGAVYYSDTSLTASGNTRVEVGGFLTGGNVLLSGNLNMSGLIYAGGKATFSGNTIVRGSVVSGSAELVSTLDGNAHVWHDETKLPLTVPPGFASTTLSRMKGTWKGY